MSAALTLAVFIPVGMARAQVDLSGMWVQVMHEDQPERGPGPDVGEFYGLPLSDEARARADTWSVEKQYAIEHVCSPHPADYAPNGPGHMRIRSEIDPVTQGVVAWHTTIYWMNPERMLWMDARPHPSENALHTWQGFSTGHWQGDILEVSTDHLKESYARRNGVARSDRAVLTEFWIRHGNILTLVTAVDDPVYLTEPLVRSRNWVYNPGYLMLPYPCVPRLAVDRPRGYVAHYLPGENDVLDEFPIKYQVPIAAAHGGAETMYPEYMQRLSGMKPPVAPKRTGSPK
jgi:hypothetical protein